MLNKFIQYNLQFIHKMEVKNSLNFLDVTVVIIKTSLTCNRYRKPLVVFCSLTILTAKKGVMVFNLVDRAIRWSNASFHSNLHILTNILPTNGYPNDFTHYNIKRRLLKHRYYSSNSSKPRKFNFFVVHPSYQTLHKRFMITFKPF